MKNLFKCGLLLAFCCILITCKKYDEGGWVRRTCKHLFGSNKVGAKKTWKLDKYIVNDIDSTYLINTGNISDFYSNFVTFEYSAKGGSPQYQAYSNIYSFQGSISITSKQLLVGSPNSHLTFTHGDSTQCGDYQGSTVCVRRILYPDVTAASKAWSIRKLTSTQVVLEIALNNSYKVILKEN